VVPSITANAISHLCDAALHGWRCTAPDAAIT
jgi:hypothetical protein